MPEPISSPNPDVSAANPTETDPVTPTSGTANQGEIDTQTQINPDGDPGTQQGPIEESFTQLDVSKLSAENQEAYKNMLTDYKRKTQTLAEEKRRLADAAEKAQMFEQIASDEAFVKYWNSQGQVQAGQTPQASPPMPTQQEIDSLSDEEFDSAFQSKEKFQQFLDRQLERRQGTLKKELDATKANLRVEMADRFVKEFKQRPDYRDFDRYDKHKFISYQVALNKPHPNSSVREWEQILSKSYKNAKAVYGDIYNEGYQAGLKRLNEKAGNAMEPPAGGAPGPVYEQGDPKNLSTSEAVALAKRGIRVPQDW